MAAWIPKTVIRVPKNQNVYVTGYAIQNRDCSSKPRIIKNPTTASLKRGTGGRSSFNGMVCTIFGCNGFIGRHLCNRFGKIGTQLILPHRCDRYHVLPLKLCGDLGQVFFHPWDLNDEESIIRTIKYSNVVINAIGTDFETFNFTFKDVHVDGARRLARLAKECKVERFIHLSCLNADKHPPPVILNEGSAILKTKWEGECAVKEEFPEATIVRSSDVYGQGDNFLSHYMHPYRRSLRTLPLWNMGKVTEKQPVHISDVAAGIVAIALDPRTAGKTYQFVGPKRYQLIELISWFLKLACLETENVTMKVVDMRLHPVFRVKVLLNELIYRMYPAASVTWEILEKHHASDNVRPGIPMLEDLGIVPVDMETRIPWELKPYGMYNHFVLQLGEIVAPPPPKTVPIH